MVPIVVQTKSKTSTLIKRDGTAVDVLFVENEPCSSLKKQIMQKFNIVSDVYGEKQEFHITLGPKEVNVAKIGNGIYELRFDKLVFSIMEPLVEVKSKQL